VPTWCARQIQEKNLVRHEGHNTRATAYPNHFLNSLPVLQRLQRRGGSQTTVGIKPDTDFGLAPLAGKRLSAQSGRSCGPKPQDNDPASDTTWVPEGSLAGKFRAGSPWFWPKPTPGIPLDGRGPPPTSTSTKNHPRRPIPMPFRGTQKSRQTAFWYPDRCGNQAHLSTVEGERSTSGFH